MKFTKMHGIGNDYVYVNGFEEKLADPGGTRAESLRSAFWHRLGWADPDPAVG